MTEKDFVEKNIKLSFEFSKYLIAHPELEEKIPDGAQVVILLEDDPEFNKKSRLLAKQQLEEDQPVVFIRVKGIAPEQVSCLISPELELSASI